MAKNNIELDIDTAREFGPINSSPEDTYPEFTFEYDEDIVPKCGRMIIEYEIVRKVVDDKRPEDSRYSCTVQVRKLISAEPEKDIRPSQRDTSSEDALDALAKAKSEENDDDEGEY